MSTATEREPTPEKPIEDVEPTTKPAAPEDTPAEIYTRRVILASFWFVVIFLGLPYWLWTTSIYRAELDTAAAKTWIDGQGCNLDFLLRIQVSSDDLSSSEQQVFDEAFLASANDKGLYRYSISGSTDPDMSIRVIRSSDVRVATPPSSAEPRLTIDCGQRPGLDDVRACGQKAAEELRALHAHEEASIVFLTKNTPFQRYELGDTTDLERRSTRAFKYASSYHVTFSLFTATSLPRSWDIEAALRQYISPLLQSLSSVSNFTVDTQVQYFASMSPSMAGPTFDDASKTWVLNESDLSGFINAAEWPLNPSIDSGPTINLVLYLPSPEKSPLLVAGSQSNSWIIPQWGGVQILDGIQGEHLGMADLEVVMHTFGEQLTALMGLPQHTPSPQLRLKALTRERITSLILSTSSTLGALIRLTEKLEQIAIPQTVAEAVTGSVDDLAQACRLLEQGELSKALIHARHADEAVERAFFEPSMVGQVYFPDEHKVAVYVPLLGPMAVPLVMATLKEIKKYRQKFKTS